MMGSLWPANFVGHHAQRRRPRGVSGHKDCIGSSVDPYRVAFGGRTLRGALTRKFDPFGMRPSSLGPGVDFEFLIEQSGTLIGRIVIAR
jgi:hypothetical protein